MVIKALVPVRSGSERVPNKNIRPFGGSNLLEIKLNQLKRISNIDSVVVNSNDESMLKVAQRMNCETVLRDPKFASNSISMSDVYKNMALNMECDVIAYINVTNPLIEDETIFNAIECYKNNIEQYDSLNTAHLIKEFLFKENMPINYDLRNQPRSQDLPDISALNFAVNVIAREKMVEFRNVVGVKPNIFIIDAIEASDIDNPIDFDFTEFIFKQRLFSSKNYGKLDKIGG